jgi:sigma-B regulation protein RsbU (phosphoserine phosphatase)
MSLQAAIEGQVSGPVFDAEKDEARQIQYSLLPAEDLKGEGFEIACRFSPFAEVGGDFADFFCLPDGQAGLYVGDVVGKGLPAAMYSALVMGMLRGINKTGENTASVLALLNKRLLVRPVSGRYAATLYALYDPATLMLTFSNAGLPYPLHASEAGCTPLGLGGLPSGLFPGSSYDLHSVQLAAGDAVLFATDGLHELRNRQGADFSWEKLTEIWLKCQKRPASESLEILFEGAMAFAEGGRYHDDITAVVLKIPSTSRARESAGRDLISIRGDLRDVGSNAGIYIL